MCLALVVGVAARAERAVEDHLVTLLQAVSDVACQITPRDTVMTHCCARDVLPLASLVSSRVRTNFVVEASKHPLWPVGPILTKKYCVPYN